ncbi:MAG: FAD-dependent oxidoreductase, partial [Clostridia bacterium]|nr:FAD-dependent oxidoreductase [Clostridia bacterium]
RLIKHISKNLMIFENTPVISWDGAHFHTPKGKIKAKTAIIATHFPFLNKHGGYFLKMYQHRSYVTVLDGAQIIRDMYVDGSGNGLSFRPSGSKLLLGGGGHRTGKDSSSFHELDRFSGIHYPNAVKTAQWSVQDCMTLDGIPYIGQYSKATPNIYVAAGFNKWGITSSMVSANVLTGIICGEQPDYAEVFSPSRSMLHPQLFTNSFEAALNFLRLTGPRCPHMGCSLRWNRHEHSWDCPCHGSRFDHKGKLLDGPATDDVSLR